MKAKYPIGRLAAALLCAAPLATRADIVGLNESVWDTLPPADAQPVASSITAEQTYTESTAPTYSFVNTVGRYDYPTSGATTVANWFGSDAAGAALSDTTSVTSDFAINASGYFDVPVAGSYTFDILAVDDAARITVDGNIVAQRTWYTTLTPTDTLTLSAGQHSFDLFFYQAGGGYALDVQATGPGDTPLDIVPEATPEPGQMISGLAIAGLGGLSLVVRRLRKRA